MRVEQVKELPARKQFLYWIKERHQIYLKRRKGLPKPWTDDEVLQNYFFTCPYRENDKTTRWFADNIRDERNEFASVLMATVIFRWFNYIPTGELLIKHNLLDRWNSTRAVEVLKDQEKIFTGAFMIKAGNGPPGSKLPSVCNAINPLWADQRGLCNLMRKQRTLEAAHTAIKQYKHLGGFMAYEIVSDLRWTYLLRDAKDINTWCNVGPGALRGMQRFYGLPVDLRGSREQGGTPKLPPDWKDKMVEVLQFMQRNLTTMPPFEMREAEHCLCEFDKYQRALLNQGKMKRKYKGV